VTGESWSLPFESPEAVAVALHLAFPAYTVTVRRDRGEPRYQLLAKDGRNPTCLISPDAQEIWDELRGK
jgi:hypothetical protein